MDSVGRIEITNLNMNQWTCVLKREAHNAWTEFSIFTFCHLESLSLLWKPRINFIKLEIIWLNLKTNQKQTSKAPSKSHPWCYQIFRRRSKKKIAELIRANAKKLLRSKWHKIRRKYLFLRARVRHTRQALRKNPLIDYRHVYVLGSSSISAVNEKTEAFFSSARLFS